MIISWIKRNPITGYLSLFLMSILIILTQGDTEWVDIQFNLLQGIGHFSLPQWSLLSAFIITLIILLPHFYKTIGLNSKYYHVYSFFVFLGLANPQLNFDVTNAFGMVFIIFAFSKLFATFNESVVKVDLFETSLWFALAFFMSKEFFLLIPLMLIGITIIRSFKWNEIINLLLSYILITVGGLTLLYIISGQFNFVNLLPFSESNVWKSFSFLPAEIYLLLIGILVLRLMLRSKYLNIKSQQIHNVLFWTFFTMIAFQFTAWNNYGFYGLLLVSSATSINNFIKQIKKSWIQDLLFLLVFALFFLGDQITSWLV